MLLILAGSFVAYYAWVEVRELQGGASSRVVQWSRDLQGALQRWVERTGPARLAVAALIVIAAAVAITLVVRAPHRGRDGDDGRPSDRHRRGAPARR